MIESFGLVMRSLKSTLSSAEILINVATSVIEYGLLAHLYRHRWDIEVFFKRIKQNIVVKNLWGYSEKAVRSHLWIAIIAYLIIAKIKADCSCA